LDAGCGDGKNALFLEDLGFSVTGVELSHHALDLLQVRFRAAGHVPKGTYVQAEITAWHPDRLYNLIVSYGLYHCLPTADRVAKHRMLQSFAAPGGIILFCSITDGLPMPDDHLTPGVVAPSRDEIASLWDGYDVIETVVDEIEESHPPHVGTHRHELEWVVARARS
jgi:cyclopropane fatty-acyl-phospholipid synthase-like methyltransferase